MTFAGYVPLNRGIIEHTMDGRLTNNEALVFVWLLMLADRRTGSYTINQPTLRVFLPELSKGAAQDALASLERKRYIYRAVVPRAKNAYRYWIDNFIPTDGAHKSSRLDLSEVFETKDISKLRYVKVNPETPPVTLPQGQPQTPNSNKKREREEIQETPSLPSEFEVSEKVSANVSECVSQMCGRGEFEVSEKVSQMVSGSVSGDDGGLYLPPGYELKDGYGGPGVYSPYGLKLSPTQIANLKRTP